MAALVLGTAPGAGAAHSDRGCDSCHVPHNASSMPGIPLWNGHETTTTFTMYSSPTLQATIDNQPSGASRLCLSCHDGANPRDLWMSDTRTFGADKLVTSHPISFVHDSALASTDGALKDPSQPSTLGRTIAQDLVDGASKVQCTSCHDIHTTGVGEYSLRGYNYGTETVTNPDGTTSQVRHGPELCRMCHVKQDGRRGLPWGCGDPPGIARHVRYRGARARIQMTGRVLRKPFGAPGRQLVAAAGSTPPDNTDERRIDSPRPAAHGKACMLRRAAVPFDWIRLD